MTKKEMMYEIISNTKLHSISERRIENLIAKIKKDRMEEIYEHFASDKEHALFYYSLLVSGTF